MTGSTFRQIIKDCQRGIKRLAKQSGQWEFCNLHQKEIIKSARGLLELYPRADRKIVLIACWLHDIAYYYAENSRDLSKIRKDHHKRGAAIAESFLKKYGLARGEVAKIKRCILNHRNTSPYQPSGLEEKIVAVADTLSHFESIFYFTYFKTRPDSSFADMVDNNLTELKQDWRDFALLPKSKRLVAEKYRTIKQLMESFSKAP